MADIKKILSYAVLGAVLILSGCGETSLRVAQERSGTLAAQHSAVIAAYGGLYDEPRPVSYVQAVLDRVLVAQNDKGLTTDKNFKAYVLDDNGVDAFALTDGRGGWIYITRGFLALLGDEAQLASVLAHEIAHIELRHTRYRRSRNADVRHKQYSHAQENKADIKGMDYLAQAGYQPSAHLQVLLRLQEYDDFRMREGQGAVAWRNAHRITPKRQTLITAEASRISDTQKNKRFIRAQKRFLNAIDGLLFTRTPARDYFMRGRRLHHSGLNIQFEVPQGFHFASGISEKIIAQHKNGLELVFDNVERSTALRPDEYLIEQWAQGLSPPPPQNLSVAGADAAQVHIRDATQNVTLLVIKHKTDWLRFALFSPPHLTGQTQSVINALRRSFAFEVGAEKPRDQTLRIVQVQRGDSVLRLAQRMDYEGDKTALFLILNGLKKDGILRAASAVKLID